MPRPRLSLLDRAESDLRVAKLIMAAASYDADIDMAAYHAQQCVEKTAKYLITLEGSTYAPEHRTDAYLEDLKDGEVKAAIQAIAYRIDTWATAIRYHHTLVSNKKAVEEVIAACDGLVAIARARTPKPAGESGLAGAEEILKRQ